jgi:ion channel-forming bestrophin family protein
MSQIDKDKFYALNRLFDLNVFKKLFLGLFLIGAYTFALTYLHVEIYKNEYKISNIIHSLLGIALGLLLVFRTNTAYERWWEGRKILGGLNNASRCLAIQVQSYFKTEEDKVYLGRMIVAYAFALKNHLRDILSIEDNPTLTSDEKDVLTKIHHKPNKIASLISQFISQKHHQQEISDIELLNLTNLLNEFTNAIGGCERIKRTPMPLAYRVHLSQFLTLYLITLPLVIIHELQYWSILILVFTYYALVGLRYIGEEIEDPFGTDVNDLPMDSICENIHKNIFEILEIKSS